MMSQLHLISRPIRGDKTIYYKNFVLQLIRRPYQRSFYLNVEKMGVVKVSCSLSTSFKEICDFVDGHSHWIEKRLLEIEKNKKKYPKKHFLQGEKFYFCGELKTLHFCHGSKISFCIKDSVLEVCRPSFNIEDEKWFSYLIQFYKSQAQCILNQKVCQYAIMMNLKPSKVSFRRQKTLFGSCTEDGKLSLNWTLVAAPHKVMNYIIVHELAHLRYMDHSNLFWNLVQKYDPHYLESKKWLQKNTYYFDFLMP